MAQARQRSAAPTPAGESAPPARGPAGARPPSLRRRAAWLLVLFALVPALVVSSLLIGLGVGTTRERFDVALQAGVARLLEDTEAGLGEYRRALELVARGPEPRSLRSLSRLASVYPVALSVLATDAQGRVVGAVPGSRPVAEATGSSIADRANFTVPRDTGLPYVSGRRQQPKAGDDLRIAVSAPIVGAGGRFDGVVEMALDLAQLSTRLQASVLEPRTALVLDAEGRVIAASDALAMATADDVRSTPLVAAALAAPPGGSFTARNQDGALWHGAVRTSSDGWMVATFLPERYIVSQIMSGALVSAAVLALSLLVALLALRMAVRRLWQPVTDLTAAIRESVQRGEVDPRVRSGLGRELLPIADAVDDALVRERSAIADSARALASQREAQQRLDSALRQREYEVERRTAALRQAVEAFKVRSVTDELTGLANYRGFRERLEELWSISRSDSVRLAVAAMDIDFFKNYNDHYGHPLGDDCLRRIGALAREVLGGSARLIARTGGEEITALFLGELDGDILRRLGQLADALDARRIEHASSPIGRVTLSIGLASTVAQAGSGPDRLVEQADRALYQAKRSGRNRIVSAEDSPG
jgi:diguanylate cyclase (GGDEF)-like protein